MLINIGQNWMVSGDDILGIFDLDNTTVSKSTRDYINASVKKDECITVSMDDLPKSFIVSVEKGERKVYISPFNASTIYKRIEEK